MSKVNGANLDFVTDVVTGLPVSDLDHGTLYSIYCVTVQLSSSVSIVIGAELICCFFVFNFALFHLQH
jgi:hypothetical protein